MNCPLDGETLDFSYHLNGTKKSYPMLWCAICGTHYIAIEDELVPMLAHTSANGHGKEAVCS